MAKQAILTNASAPLPKMPVFRPFTTFESKSYIKKAALKVWASLSQLDLTSSISDLESAQ